MQIVLAAVVPDSPAEKAGLRAGDQLMMVGNIPAFGAKSMEEIAGSMNSTPCGEIVRVMFRRNGIPTSVDIQLETAGQVTSHQNGEHPAATPNDERMPGSAVKPIEADPSSPPPEAIVAGMAALQAALDASPKVVADATNRPSTEVSGLGSRINLFEALVPTDYPPFPEHTKILPLTIEQARLCRDEADHLKKIKPVQFPQGYFLDRANFEGETGRKFASSLLVGTEVGGATLSFYLLTPYSEARFRFYQAKKQFEKLTAEDVVKDLEHANTAVVVVLQNADVERLAGNLAGFGSLVYNKLITKVVIKRGEIIYQPLGNEGAGWAFPLGVFGGDEYLEVIAVSSDNRHATVTITPSDLALYR